MHAAFALSVLLTLAPVPEAVTADQKLEAAMIAAIHLFSEHGEIDHLRTLVEKYPKLVNEKQRFRQPRKPLTTDDYVPLHWAARTGRVEVARVLLLNGANPNLDCGGGWSPLHIAAREGSLEVVKELIEHGAKPDAKTEPRPERTMVPPSSPPGAKPVHYPAVPAMTARDVAIQFKKADVAEYLK